MEQCCENPSLELVTGETNEVCTECGTVTSSIAFCTYALKFEVFVKDNYSGENYRGYKRVNHFISSLYQLIGVSRSDIPKDVLVKTVGLLNLDEIRNALKGYKKSRYIRCGPRILEINMKMSSSFKCENIKKSIYLFNQIDRVWSKKKNVLAPRRKSFLPYNFITRKIMQTLGEHDIMRRIKSVKSEKLSEQLECYWKEIKKDLHWL
jgi:hypothetical protein